jgi:hypothetical protein
MLISLRDDRTGSLDRRQPRVVTAPAVVADGRVPSVGPPPRFRLGARAYRTALTAHILSSVGWFGTALMIAFCALAAAGSGDPGLSHALFRTIEIAPWLSVPLGILAVATGAVLGVGTKWGLIRHWWVVVKIAIALAVLATDPLLIATAAHRAAVSGHAPSWLYGPTLAHVVVLTLATLLSVFKLGGRTPRGRRLVSR